MSFAQKMQKLYHQYENEVAPGEVVDLDAMYAWVRKNNLWEPQPSDVRRRFKSEMGDALRQEYRTNEQGRSYRANHAVREYDNDKKRQRTLWADIDSSASLSHMKKSTGQRRKQIVGDCVQLRVDVDHYNDINPEQEQIPLILDFYDDVEEALVMDEEESAA